MTDGSPQLLQLDVREHDGRTVLAVAGELDIATAGQLGGEVRRQLADGPVVLDLRDLTFADSAGVRTLFELHREAVEQGRDLAIDPELHEHVRQLLELTNLMDVLPFAAKEGA